MGTKKSSRKNRPKLLPSQPGIIAAAAAAAAPGMAAAAPGIAAPGIAMAGAVSPASGGAGAEAFDMPAAKSVSGGSTWTGAAGASS